MIGKTISLDPLEVTPAASKHTRICMVLQINDSCHAELDSASHLLDSETLNRVQGDKFLHSVTPGKRDIPRPDIDEIINNEFLELCRSNMHRLTSWRHHE